jgi:hypothetical protein
MTEKMPTRRGGFSPQQSVEGNDVDDDDDDDDELKQNLSIKIERIWNMKCFVIPVITGTTGIVSK